MTCQKCSTLQLLDSPEDELVCPKCEGIELLSKEEAIKVVDAQLNWFDGKFKQELGSFNKSRLLVWLFGYREKIATKFFEDCLMKLREFLSVNVLIKRVMEDYDRPGDEEANDENTPELIDSFATYIDLYEDKCLIEGDFGHYVAKKDYNLNNMEDLMSFPFKYNEEYIPILESFKDNLIMNDESAEKFYQEHRKEYEAIHKSKPKPIKKTPEETIEELFPTLLSFYCGLAKNKYYAENLDLQYLKDADISPKFIFYFIKKFPERSGLMTGTTPKEFKRVIRVKFKDVDKNVAYNNLVFSNENKDIFPFFLEVDGNVMITPNSIRQICLYYYPLYYKSEFDKQKQKHSAEFEKITVPDRLKKLGFKVIPNYTDKKKASLQIDQIAWKDDKLYVIETKIWDLKPYFEHRYVHGQMERDLKGIVDGKKHSTISGKTRIENIPSLLEKIKHVEDNLSAICKEDYMNIKEASGVVITKSHPIIKEYKGVNFISFLRMDTL